MERKLLTSRSTWSDDRILSSFCLSFCFVFVLFFFTFFFMVVQLYFYRPFTKNNMKIQKGYTVYRSRKSKKDRQYNGLSRQQNIIRNTKDWATRTPEISLINIKYNWVLCVFLSTKIIWFSFNRDIINIIQQTISILIFTRFVLCIVLLCISHVMNIIPRYQKKKLQYRHFFAKFHVL